MPTSRPPCQAPTTLQLPSSIRTRALRLRPWAQKLLASNSLRTWLIPSSSCRGRRPCRTSWIAPVARPLAPAAVAALAWGLGIAVLGTLGLDTGAQGCRLVGPPIFAPRQSPGAVAGAVGPGPQGGKPPELIGQNPCASLHLGQSL